MRLIEVAPTWVWRVRNKLVCLSPPRHVCKKFRAGLAARVQVGPGQGARRHLLGRERLGLLQKGVYVISTAGPKFTQPRNLFQVYILNDCRTTSAPCRSCPTCSTTTRCPTRGGTTSTSSGPKTSTRSSTRGCCKTWPPERSSSHEIMSKVV